jgi:hypothetical protein
MSALSQFEEFMERTFEGSARRLFRSQVTPAEITRRLERAMESQQTITVDRVIVPSFYRAFLNPEDFAAYESFQDDLEKEMASYLRDLARERGFSLLQHPVVDVASDPAVSRRTIQVVAEMTGVHPGNQPNGAPPLGVDTTQVIPPPPRQGGRAAGGELLMQTVDGQRAFALDVDLATIGRGLNNTIVLEDPRISRQHAQVRWKSRRYLISDLGSTNGTYVNGVPVSAEQVLRPGDIVSLGGLELQFQQR